MNYKLNYFKINDNGSVYKPESITLTGEIAMTIQHLLLDYVGSVIPMTRPSLEFNQDLLLEPKRVSDDCKTVLSCIGDNTNHFRLQRVSPNENDVLGVFKRIQELSEQDYSIIFMMDDD